MASIPDRTMRGAGIPNLYLYTTEELRLPDSLAQEASD
jgi:hypothetical protein